MAKAYFWHRFFSHQPDLNYDNPEVHEAMFKVVDFWLDLGVDGLRLDAVPYLYEREGTNCENLPETHAFLKKLRAHVDEKYGDRMLLAEANQWPEDAVAYFGQGRGDECHMAFHFPLMPRLFMAVRMEDRLPIVDILEQTPPIPETSQWALFLRNHDELTLEMVTDEERDYMYRMYAQVHQARLNLGIRRRLAPLLSNDRKSIELLNALLLSLPGTPGALLRRRNRPGRKHLSRRPQRRAHADAMECGQKRRLLARQSAEPLPADHPRPRVPLRGRQRGGATGQSRIRCSGGCAGCWRCANAGARSARANANSSSRRTARFLRYVLRHEQETILVVANLSRFTQPVELDLSAFKTLVPIELFGRTKFPGHHGRTVFSDARPAQFLLVFARTQVATAVGAAGNRRRRRHCRPSPSPHTGRTSSPASRARTSRPSCRII